MVKQFPLFILGALLVVDGLLSLDVAAIAIGVISLIAAIGIQRATISQTLSLSAG